MTIEHFASENVPSTLPQSDAARFDDFLFVRSQLAWDDNGQITDLGDFSAQFDRAFDNLSSALSRAGGSLNDVVRMRYHFFDGRNYIDARRARHRVWPTEGPPASVVVSYGLPEPQALGGLEAIAYLGDDREVVGFSDDFAHSANTPDYGPETRGKVGYSPAIRASNLAFLAGVVAMDAQDNYLHLGDPDGQTRVVHDLSLSVLAQLGLERDAAVKFFQFATYPHYYDRVHEITADYFPQRPPSSPIVASLGWPGNIIESEITAAVGVSPEYSETRGYVAVPGVKAAVRVGGLLFSSAIVARTSDGELVGPGDGRAQLDQIFSNIVDLLASAAREPTDILMLNVYLAAPTLFPIWEESKEDFWKKYFGPSDPFPPYAAVAVTALPSYEHLVQVDVIAAGG